MNFNLFQSSNNNNNQLGQSPLDFMSDDDGELDFSAVMQQELESHDLLLMQSEGAAHHHPLSPPTVIIPSSSSNNINNNCADDGDLYKSNVLASAGDHHQNMMFPLNFVGGHTTPHVNTTTSNDQQQHSPRTPRLNLDAASVLQSWLLILDNTITNNNNNNNINNNNHNSSTTTPIHNNNNNLNLNNNNNINLNNINHHTTYNNTTSDQSLQDTLENLIQNNKHRQQIHDMLTNNSNNNTTTSMQSQSYLGSVLANCTSIHSPNMRSTMNQRSNNHSHQHSKSPSFGSGNYNSKLNSGVRKASSQRSNSTSCFQSIQSYTASKMHLAAAAATSMMNMNGGLNSPSVASTCSSNLTMSPANVSTNSFNQLINNNNGHMSYMSNSNSNNNNSSSATVGSSSHQQYSPIVTNQQQMVAGATVSGSNKKGKLPANRPVVDKNSNNQFTFVNSQHSKGLLVEANPNDKPIKMQQCKIVDGGIKIQIEDGISKNKKDTGLQFHTCTFK